MLIPPEANLYPPFYIMSKRYSKAVTSVCAAAIFFLLLRTVNRAFNHEPLLRIGPLHGADLWGKVLETGESRWRSIQTRMSPDPGSPPPFDNTNGESIFHSGKYLAIYLGPPGQPEVNRKGGGSAFQKFVAHLPLNQASEIPLTETYFDVGIRRDPYDRNMEDYQLGIRNTGEPHGILIVRSLHRGRDPKLTVSDAMFYSWREFATKLVGPGHSWRPISNLRYVIFDTIKVRETVEVIEQAYSKFNYLQKANSDLPILMGEFHHWLYKSKEREMMLAMLGTPNVASMARMLGDHFNELGHKCIIGLATERIDEKWFLGALIGNEFGGECLDREVPDVVKGDRYIQEYKEEQARKEEVARQEAETEEEEKAWKEANEGLKKGKTRKPLSETHPKEEEGSGETQGADGVFISDRKPPTKEELAEELANKEKDKTKDDEEDSNLLPGETNDERQAKLQRSFRKQVDRNVKDLKKGAVIAD